MIRFAKGEMKKKLEETMAFLQSVESEPTQEMNDEKLSRPTKSS